MLSSQDCAVALVSRIGVSRAYRLLAAITRRVDRRYNALCLASFSPMNREWVRRTPLEVTLMHQLKLGIALLDDFHTPSAARARIQARLAARRAQRGSV